MISETTTITLSIIGAIISSIITSIIVYRLNLKKLERFEKFKLNIKSYSKISKIIEKRNKRYFDIVEDVLKKKDKEIKDNLKKIANIKLNENEEFPWQDFSFFKSKDSLNCMKDFLDKEQEIIEESKRNKTPKEIKKRLGQLIKELIEKKVDLIEALKEELKI